MRSEQSYTRLALELALSSATSAGAPVDLIDLAAFHLPLCSSPEDRDDNPQTQELKARVGAAQGILLGSPEYHNSFSGVLKKRAGPDGRR